MNVSFLIACKTADVDKAQQIASRMHMFDILCHITESSDIDIIKFILNNNLVNPSAEGNYAIRKAVVYGYTNVVKLLLKDGRVDPTVDDNYAINCAAYHEYVDVTKLLLKDKRVRDAGGYDNDNDTIKQAMRETLYEKIYHATLSKNLQGLPLPSVVIEQMMIFWTIFLVEKKQNTNYVYKRQRLEMWKLFLG